MAESETLYAVQGDYGFGDGWEAVTHDTDRAAAMSLLADYRANEPGIPFRVRKVRA